MHTPAFLLWALETTCPIRGLQDGSDPERTERHLRAARAVSDARQEGRVLEGLCFDPPFGFRIDDALVLYGGLPTVEQTCRVCPANSTSWRHPKSLAGCFGLLPLPEDGPNILSAVDAALAAQPSSEYAGLFPVTEPAWYGLWMRSPLEQQQSALLLEVLNVTGCAASLDGEFAALQAGLHAAVQNNLRFHARLYPPGTVADAWWRLAPHCTRCRAPWDNPTSPRCGVCGHSGRPASDKQRRARGRRPYFPLDRLLGSRAAAEFLLKYEALRAQPGSIPPAQSPLRAAPRDNPPAD